MAKERLNFAQRVSVKLVPKANINNSSSQKDELQKQINAHKVLINRGEFAKTDKEKAKLKEAKAEWKESLKATVAEA